MRLADVCEVNPTAGRKLDRGQLCSFVPMESVDDWSATIVQRSTRRVGDVCKGYTPFQDGDVIVAKITPCMENGKCALARNLANGVGYGSTEFHVLRAGQKALPEWLYYFWRHPPTRRKAERSMRGSAGQQRVPYEFFDSVEIPVPPLPLQRRIAGVLGQADRLRRMRRYALELSDQFLPALFFRVFGDSLDRPAGRQLRDCVTISGGGTPSRDRLEYYAGRIPWLTSKDMTGDYIWDTEEHVTEEAVAESATKLVPAGSVLIVVKSKVLAHSLPVAIAKVPLCHGQDIKSLQCNDGMLPEFVRFLLKYHAPRLLRIARGANTEGLTLPMLHELPVPDVPNGEQRAFAEQVRRVEQARAAYRESLRQAEHLFQSLLNQSFGENVSGTARN